MPSSDGPTLGHCSGLPWLSSQAGASALLVSTSMTGTGPVAVGAALGGGGGAASHAGGGRGGGGCVRSRKYQPPAPPAASVVTRIKKSERSMASLASSS